MDKQNSLSARATMSMLAYISGFAVPAAFTAVALAATPLESQDSPSTIATGLLAATAMAVRIQPPAPSSTPYARLPS